MRNSQFALLRTRFRAWLAGSAAEASPRPGEGRAPPEPDPDFAEERTFSESNPAAQSPKGKGDEAPHWPTRVDGGPGRLV